MKLNSKLTKLASFVAREMKKECGYIKKLLRGFALNIRNQIQSNKSFKSFNIFQNIKICSTNDYTVFPMRDKWIIFEHIPIGSQKEKKKLIWEAGKRSIH